MVEEEFFVIAERVFRFDDRPDCVVQNILMEIWITFNSQSQTQSHFFVSVKIQDEMS